MKKCIILQGLPGSGKTTYARKLADEGSHTSYGIVSADDYFYVLGMGKYAFDPKLLPEAHQECLRFFVNCASTPATDNELLIVDNTNTTVAEVAPYYAVAEAFGWECEIHQILCSPQTAHERNIHGVTRSTVDAMYERLGRFTNEAPRWWRVTYHTQTRKEEKP